MGRKRGKKEARSERGEREKGLRGTELKPYLEKLDHIWLSRIEPVFRC